jgi:hypothetical protein
MSLSYPFRTRYPASSIAFSIWGRLAELGSYSTSARFCSYDAVAFRTPGTAFSLLSTALAQAAQSIPSILKVACSTAGFAGREAAPTELFVLELFPTLNSTEQRLP